MSSTCSALQLCLLQLRSVCSNVWPTLRFLERTGTGDTGLTGVVGSGFQAASVAFARGCLLAAALYCLIELRLAGAHSYVRA